MDPEFDQFKSCTHGPDFSCQALAEGLKENSTLKNLDLQWNEIGDEGAKAWCLVRMVGKKGHRGRIKTQSLESEVSEMFTSSEWNALKWIFVDLNVASLKMHRDSSLVVLWWSDWLGFKFFFGKYLSSAVSEQM